MNLFKWFQKKALYDDQKGIVPSRFNYFGVSEIAVNEEKALKTSAVLSCVQVISQTLSTLPLKVYESLENDVREAKEHPLYGLLSQYPNDDQTRVRFVKTLMRNVLIRGCGFVQIRRNGLRKIVALNVIPTGFFKKIESEEVTGKTVFIFQSSTGDRRFYNEDLLVIPFLDDESLLYRGIIESPLDKLGVNALEMGIAVDERTMSYHANGSISNGAVEVQKGVSQAVLDAVKEQFSRVYSGIRNTGKTLFLQDGMKWVSRPANSEADFLAQRKYQLEEVARIYRIPLAILQNLDKGTFANVEQQDLNFTKHTIQPWITAIEQELNAKLFRNTPFYAEFNIDGLQRGDFKTRIEALTRSIQSGLMTPNEARQKMGLPALAGGENLFIQQNMVGVQDLGHEDTSQEPENDTGESDNATEDS